MNVVDPLADTAPPRHAYESDDEDEYDPSATTSPAAKATSVDVKIAGAAPKGHALLVASGDAARIWARGAQLGEQQGAVFVNNVQVGMIFAPSWTESAVLVSEVTTRLPTWAMHGYAGAVLEALDPSRLALLDVYPVHSYISQDPILVQDAPIRYLCVNGSPPTEVKGVKLFAPPNLLQSTSASFMALATLSSADNDKALPASLILLPSPRVPPPAPADLAASSFAGIGGDSPWPMVALQSASKALLACIGGKAKLEWDERGKTGPSSSSASRRGDIGDGGMYI